MFDTLRMLHVLFGIFFGGTYLFMVPILEPRLKRLGPAVHGPVMQVLMPVMTPIMATSFIILVGTGVTMTLILKQGSIGALLTTGWGWDIIVGFLATVVVAIIGFGMLTPTGIRMDKLGRSIKGRAPSPAEARQLQQLSHRVDTLSHVNFVFVVITIISMVVARFL